MLHFVLWLICFDSSKATSFPGNEVASKVLKVGRKQKPYQMWQAGISLAACEFLAGFAREGIWRPARTLPHPASYAGYPTRYRQSFETQSLNQLTSEEQRVLSEGQKHSSAVVKVHYQKQRSREVACLKGYYCLQKLQGAKGSEVDEDVYGKLFYVYIS